MDDGSGDPIGLLMIITAITLMFIIAVIPTKHDDDDKF